MAEGNSTRGEAPHLTTQVIDAARFTRGLRQRPIHTKERKQATACSATRMRTMFAWPATRCARSWSSMPNACGWPPTAGYWTAPTSPAGSRGHRPRRRRLHQDPHRSGSVQAIRPPASIVPRHGSRRMQLHRFRLGTDRARGNAVAGSRAGPCRPLECRPQRGGTSAGVLPHGGYRGGDRRRCRFKRHGSALRQGNAELSTDQEPTRCPVAPGSRQGGAHPWRYLGTEVDCALEMAKQRGV